ncbi:flavin reductase family protein [Sphingobacterium sp. lm-10]|uniref:flavin reductase family protein n=1 Tax=Sphingobacterium sp. lm-10 TaxID=2944904 RepID=UPI0020201B02|nr:flavin reductase family protein [Sphingobacterium sp. lm-10]MCL7987313.1 flavin reductase family protein [Sphingobacterium sp. lm-10]
MTVDFKNLSVPEAQHYLQHAVAPRPICFASTINAQGQVNLSPFSFFNVFSSNPPIVVFSPSRSGRKNTLKDSYINITEVPEVAISIVDYDMVHQMSLSSCEYAPEVNEFLKAGFTMQPADQIRPPLVAESKIKLECKVIDTKELGKEGGAGILVIAEVLKMHLDEDILDNTGHINPLKVRQVARLGGDWYVDVKPEYMFLLPKPAAQLGIGVDELPEKVLQSKIFTGNHRGQLANVSAIPSWNEEFDDPVFHHSDGTTAYEERIVQLLDMGQLTEAWQIVLRWEMKI